MNQKKAKALRRLARQICHDIKKPHMVDKQYRMMKKAYKTSKGQI